MGAMKTSEGLIDDVGRSAGIAGVSDPAGDLSQVHMLQEQVPAASPAREQQQGLFEQRQREVWLLTFSAQQTATEDSRSERGVSHAHRLAGTEA